MKLKIINDIKKAFETVLENDSSVKHLITDYESAVQALQFIEKEKEMRIKFPEIWKMQHTQSKENLEILKQQLSDTGTKNKIDIEGIFKEHENKSLSQEDFRNMA